MPNAILMTDEQIAELVSLARQDRALWDALKDRELETEKALADAAKQGRHIDDSDAVLDPPKRPTRHEMLSNLVKHVHGQSENYYYGGLVVAVRRCVREELGLPQ